MDRHEPAVGRPSQDSGRLSVAAPQARTQEPEHPARRREQGARPTHTPGQDPARAAHAALRPGSSRVPPASPRPGFSPAEFNLLRWYARTHFEFPLGPREEFEGVHPQAVALAHLLDVADVVLEVVNELAAWRKKLRRDERRRRANRRSRRESGGRR